MHVKPGQAFQHEVTGPNALVGLVELPVEHQHQAHSVLRHGIGRVSRHASDAEVVLLARPHVNVVKTGATQGDHFHAERGELRHHRGVTGVIHEDADHLEPSRGLDRVQRQRGLNVMERKTATVAPFERVRVV